MADTVQTFRDFSSEEILRLKKLLAEKIITEEYFNFKVSEITSLVTSKIVSYETAPVANVLTLNRRGWFTFVTLDTEGSVPFSTVTSIVEGQNQFYDFDHVIIKLSSPARMIQFSVTDKINATMSGNADELWLTFYRGEFFVDHKNFSSSDILDSFILKKDDQFIEDVGGVKTVDRLIGTIINARSITGGTPAVGSVQLNTTPGLYGKVEVRVDKGFGEVTIGSVEYTAATNPIAEATNLESAINSLTAYHEIVAASGGTDTVTLTAPASEGANANAWVLSTVVIAITDTVVPFAGGIDGVDTASDLDSISPVSKNEIIYVRNVNTDPTAVITLTSGVGNLLCDDIKIPIGGIVPLIGTELGGWVAFGSDCCNFNHYGTRWVDENGNDATGSKNILKPYKTIRAALLASGFGQNIKVLAGADIIGYDERDLLYIQRTVIEFSPTAFVAYTGSDIGGIFDDSANGSGAAIDASIIFNNNVNTEWNASSQIITQNNSSAAAGTRTVFTISNGSYIAVRNGIFGAVDNVINISSGELKMYSSTIIGGLSPSYPAVKITGGVLHLKNCLIVTSMAAAAFDIAGGELILEDCLVLNPNASASAHGITIGGGNIIFIGTNRIVTTHAASLSINVTAASTCKLIGQLYTTNVIGGGFVITDSLTAAALVPTMTNTLVE